MGTPLSCQMSHLIDAIASIGWLIDVSTLLFILIFLMIGRGGVVRLASPGLGLGLILLYSEIEASVILTSLILPPPPGPYTLTWAFELRHAAVFAVFAAPLALSGTSWVLRQARVWWRARGTIDQTSIFSHARER